MEKKTSEIETRVKLFLESESDRHLPNIYKKKGGGGRYQLKKPR